MTSQGSQISGLSSQVASQGTGISVLNNKVDSLDNQLSQTDMQILAQIDQLNLQLIKQSERNEAALSAHSKLIDRISNRIDAYNSPTQRDIYI